ncbi:MAG: electron transfer flavoprotein subunit beta/FixA family protein [Christensenellales bacterium]|jgi:electron transfer flavoprotein beta subunit
MKIIACIKQVPATSEVRMDPEKGVLLRGTAKTRLNPYDAYAIEAALRLREERGEGSVTALTMGPPSAEKELRFAMAMGADTGVLLSDRALSGADVLATSRALAEAITALGGADVLVCGRQTTDGDTAQVGPAIAGWLGVPGATFVSAFGLDGEELSVSQALTNGSQTLKLPLPCLIAVDKSSCVPRAPTLKRKLAAAKLPITVLSLADLADSDPKHYGLLGSPTSVERIFPPKALTRGVRIEGEAEEIALEIAHELNRVGRALC